MPFALKVLNGHSSSAAATLGRSSVLDKLTAVSAATCMDAPSWGSLYTDSFIVNMEEKRHENSADLSL